VHEEVERWGLSWFNYLPLLHPQAVALLPGNYAGMAWDDAAAKEEIENRPALAIDTQQYRKTLLAIALESFLDRTMDEWPAVDEVDLDNIAEAVDNWPVNEDYVSAAAPLLLKADGVAPAPVSLALPFDWKPLAVKVAKRQGKTVTIGEQWPCHPHIPCAHGLACNTKTNKCMKKGKTALRGKTVVFTGTFPETRKVMAAKAKKAGAKVAANLTKATDILVVGRKAGQKREKARKMAVELMTEAQFRRALA
jgi:NAD-dependent DNA ligase